MSKNRQTLSLHPFHSISITLFLSMATYSIEIIGDSIDEKGNFFQLSLLLISLESKINFLFLKTKIPALAVFTKKIHLEYNFFLGNKYL